MFRRCVHIGLCKMFVQLYFLFFIITLLPDVPPEFSLMQTKIQHVCLSNVYLNGVERGVIFPNVKKQQSLAFVFETFISTVSKHLPHC